MPAKPSVFDILIDELTAIMSKPLVKAAPAKPLLLFIKSSQVIQAARETPAQADAVVFQSYRIS